MASEYVAFLQPSDLQREADLGRDPELNLAVTTTAGTPTNDLYGSVLPKYQRGNLVNFGYVTLFRVPLNLTVGTGLTFQFYLTDDGQNAIDLGKAVQLGLTVLDVTHGPSNFDLDSAETELAAEQTVTATLAAVSGKASITSLPIALANLPPSLAAGDVLAVRIRRIGTSASDTCPGRVLLMCTAVNNT